MNIAGQIERRVSYRRAMKRALQQAIRQGAEGIKIEVFVINDKGSGWLDGCKFERYLREHPEALEAYRLLKEKAAGLSTRGYYTRKIAFINHILSLADDSC